MDNNTKILLNSLKNINSVNVDTYEKIQLSNKRALINEYDIRNIVSATDIFDAEREANEIYRIYGKIEYLSLLNGLKTSYSKFQDFFTPQLTNCKNIFNSFQFYLVKPATSGYTHIISGGSTIKYVRYFDIISGSTNSFELYPVGFSNNVYGEQSYAFGFNIDFDVSSYLDNFGFPLTELFLYVRYLPTYIETLKYNNWGTNGIPVKTVLPAISNNKIYGDVLEYAQLQFYQSQLYPQTYFISTPTSDVGTLIWKYNPFISLPLRYFGNDVYKANISGTSYEQVSSIPYYATSADTAGNYVWRKILPQGYTDPLTGIGVNYPFVNKKRYLFSTIVFSIVPDLNDANTLNAFSNIVFGTSTKISTTPNDDLNNIGKPCL
jgi:hypothetical protein